jgi:phthalate 4,5-dioxygenase reductase subunit
MDAVRDMSGHWPAPAIHFESFLDSTATLRPEDRAFRVRLARSGETLEVRKDQTLMEALRASGHDIPSSCESGTCGTCRTGLLAGEADHRDLVLGEHDKATNIMVCVSRALSGELTLDL